MKVTVYFPATDGTAAYSASLLKVAVANGNLMSGLLTDPNFYDALAAAGVTVTGVSAYVVNTSAAVASVGSLPLWLISAALALFFAAW